MYFIYIHFSSGAHVYGGACLGCRQRAPSTFIIFSRLQRAPAFSQREFLLVVCILGTSVVQMAKADDLKLLLSSPPPPPPHAPARSGKLVVGCGVRVERLVPYQQLAGSEYCSGTPTGLQRVAASRLGAAPATHGANAPKRRGN